MRDGVIGISRCRTPYSDRASITALATEGRPPDVPASPQPFAPSGLLLVGTGWLATLINGGAGAGRAAALAAGGIVLGRAGRGGDIDQGCVVRARHRVVQERAGHKLPVGIV